MAKKKPEKEPKKAKKAKKTKEKPPKTSKKKKGKGENTEEAAAVGNEETGGKAEKKKKSGRGILEPVLCVLIAVLAVFEIGLVYLWLTTPSEEEIRARLEAQQPVHAAWSAASYFNRHGIYRPSDIPAPVATYATSDDVPATARPLPQADAAAPTV